MPLPGASNPPTTGSTTSGSAPIAFPVSQANKPATTH
jgi:hypothetical protein